MDGSNEDHMPDMQTRYHNQGASGTTLGAIGSKLSFLKSCTTLAETQET
jgi:hypothetical protein